MLALIVFVVAYVVSAGRANIVMSWIYFGLLIVNSIIVSLLMDPDLVRERARPGKDSKRSDFLYAAILGRIGPLVTIVISGLDVRFGWTHLQMKSGSIVAAAMMVLGLCLTDWAVIRNKYFSGVVRIQRERGHHVVSDGPYRFVRHPGYFGSMIYTLATPIILKSLWALIPAVGVAVIIVLRTANEDRILADELEGYREYSRRVTHKLIPLVW